MLAVLFTLVMVMILFPASPASQYLNRLLVEPCVRGLARVRAGHAAFTIALIGVGLALFVLFEAEGLRLFSFMAPEILAWAAVFDVAVLFDLMVFAVTLAATTRLGAVRAQALAAVNHGLARMKAVVRAGRRRARRIRPAAPRPGRSDDPDPFGLAYAG